MDIPTLLLFWYDKNKRDLPWRTTQNPYYIWLSEILLQQTRVAQGIPYYHKFIEHFPTIQDIASASQQEILSLWQGLGYYSRARNLHFTAQTIVSKHNGQFPSTYAEIIALKGIGAYTAAAIASFAFGLPYAVIDGNVNRVISRLFCIEEPVDKPVGQRAVKNALDRIFDPSRAATWNQAIMDFGSMQCTPKNPSCSTCILQSKCLAWSNNKVAHIPYKEGKTKVIDVFHSYMVILFGSKTYIQKRESGIWKNLYQFPLIESQTTENQIISNLVEDYGISGVPLLQGTTELIHKLSHRRIFAKFYTIILKSEPTFLKNNIFEIELKELGKAYPTNVLILNFLEHLNKHDKQSNLSRPSRQRS